MTELQRLNHDIDLSIALDRLKQNSDFKALILDDYLQDRVISYLSLAISSTLSKEEQEKFSSKAYAAMYLKEYLNEIEVAGASAKEARDVLMQNGEL